MISQLNCKVQVWKRSWAHIRLYPGEPRESQEISESIQLGSMPGF